MPQPPAFGVPYTTDFSDLKTAYSQPNLVINHETTQSDLGLTAPEHNPLNQTETALPPSPWTTAPIIPRHLTRLPAATIAATAGLGLTGCDGGTIVGGASLAFFLGMTLYSIAKTTTNDGKTDKFLQNNWMNELINLKFARDTATPHAISTAFGMTGIILSLMTLHAENLSTLNLTTILVALGISVCYTGVFFSNILPFPRLAKKEHANAIENGQKKFLNETLSSGLDPQIFKEHKFFEKCLQFFFIVDEYYASREKLLDDGYSREHYERSRPRLFEKPVRDYVRKGNESPFVDFATAKKAYTDNPNLFLAFMEFLVKKLENPNIHIEHKRRVAQGLVDFATHISLASQSNLVEATRPLLSHPDAETRDKIFKFHRQSFAKATVIQKQVFVESFTKSIADFLKSRSRKLDYIYKRDILSIAAAWPYLSLSQKIDIMTILNQESVYWFLGDELRILAEELRPEHEGISGYSKNELKLYIDTWLAAPQHFDPNTSTTPATLAEPAALGLSAKDTAIANELSALLDDHDITDPNKHAEALTSLSISLNPRLNDAENIARIKELLDQALSTENEHIREFAELARANMQTRNGNTTTTTSPEDATKLRAAQAVSNT